jgi:hypothetical protein
MEDEASSSNFLATELLPGGSSEFPGATLRPPSRPTAGPSSTSVHASPSRSNSEATLQAQDEELSVLQNEEALPIQASTSSSGNLPSWEISESARHFAQAQAVALSSQF